MGLEPTRLLRPADFKSAAYTNSATRPKVVRRYFTICLQNYYSVKLHIMKTCTKCGHEKPETEFFVRDKSTGRLHAQCKDCYRLHRSSYQAQHYAKYRAAYLARANVRRLAIKQALQAKMLEYLSDKACGTCGEKDPCVLDFDHLNPSTKTFGIARGISDGLKWEQILLEIEKCQILCANCHRRHTAQQKGWYKLLQTKNGGTYRI